LKRFVGPTISMAGLVVVVIILISLVPKGVPHPGYGQGCACMNPGVGAYVDGESVVVASEIPKSAKPGGSYTILITIEDLGAVTPPIMTWKPDMEDNARFKFEPQEVKDNDPNDKNSGDNVITALFTVTAPQEPGSYHNRLYIREIVQFRILVKVEGDATAATTSMIIDWLEHSCSAEEGSRIFSRGPVS